ncbi:HET-domain-containing protein [Lophium mytilinum]|uniref:HET-domain-containing protein n=1 Tax=Lophium mytilinum TaxID=390894 RepID=A0A6A6QAN3_9PEZI|nr:HET-domain-containing protein [Lophium mytilinum]
MEIPLYTRHLLSAWVCLLTLHLVNWDRVLSEASQLQDVGTGSPAATRVAIHWLRNCIAGHWQCNIAMHRRFFPTRVLDTGPPGILAEPVLLEADSYRGPYVALSHQWGTSTLPRTTLANIKQRRQSIPLAELTNTMRDAISIVRNLGFRYIWLDVACIIQDSKEDWLAESSKMADVYRSAILTLAVADAEDHSEGIFRPREAHCVRPIRFEDFRMPRRERSWFDGEGALYIVPSSHQVAKGVRPRGPLDSRGWILQEQLLSPRILYYGKGELFWDCISTSASESSPVSASLLDDEKSSETWAMKLIRRAIVGGGDPGTVQRYMQNVWIELIQNYSARSLTRPLDKLVAMEGILSAVEQIFGDAVVAGLWKDGLWRQLTWWTVSKEVTVDSQPTAARFTAPSWSWLNVETPVLYRNTLHPEYKELASVVQIREVREEVLSTKAEIRGRLTISGLTFPYLLTSDDFRVKIWKQFHRKHLNCGQWWLDEPLELPQKIECLILAEDANLKMLVCLCLIPAQEEGVFKRIGLCHWEGMRHEVYRFAKIRPEERLITIV